MTIDPADREKPSRWPARMLWFAGLWIAGVATVALVSLLLRAVIRP